MKKLLFFLALFPVLGFGQQVINLDPSSLGSLNSLLLLDHNCIFVSSGNTTGIETGSFIYPYNTIQEGLTAADAGDVVIVLQGTYSEHLTMATNRVRLMTLEGQNVSVELLQASNRGLLVTGDSVVIGGGSGMGFTFTADGGRMIEFAANEVDCEVSYNTIIVDAGGTIGINVGAAGATRLKVKNNLFKVSSGQGGFYATQGLVDCEISGNEFIGASQASGYAIQMSGFSNGIIAYNYIHADTTDGVKGFASGIFPHTAGGAASDSMRIFNNTIQDCANGIRLGHSSMTLDMKALFVYKNLISHCVDGIEIANSASVYPATYDIYDNIFSDNTNHINQVNATAGNYGMNIFDESLAVRSKTAGNVDLDYAASSADADETRHFDYAVTGTVDPAAYAGVNAGYFAYNKTAGSNGTYTINALEGVARSSYADEAGTFRGVYGRVYINADATSTMRTGIGGEFSARAGYSGGTDVIAESGTAFVGSRIWMAPYFSAASLGNVNNFHGLWIYNEHTSNKVTNGIMINDAGGTGGWTYGLNLSSATIGTGDLLLHNGALFNNVRTNNLTITEDTIQNTTDAFLIDYTASPNTVVLSPTSTGMVDTLETTDLATEDFTTTGLWGFDNVDIDSATIDTLVVTGKFYYPEVVYLFEGFEDSTVTLDLTQNVYAQVTNAGKNLWTVIDNNDITESGDTVIIATAGDYWGTYSVTFTGEAGNYRFRVYNVTDGVEEGLAVHSTGWGTGNYTVLSKPLYLKDCTAGDRFVFQIANLSNNDDATINDGALMIRFLKR